MKPASASGRASLRDKRPDPVRIVATIREQPSIVRQIAKQNLAQPIVVCLAAGEAKANWQAVGIDYDMNLAGQSAARAAHVLSAIVGDAGCMLMDADNGRVDHLDGGVMGTCQCIHDPLPIA